MADEDNHVNKNKLKVPFVCGCRNLGEALRRIAEGAAMIRTKGEAGTGDVVEAVRHARTLMKEIRLLKTMDEDEMFTYAKQIAAPYALVKQTAEAGRLPVVNFSAGGVATPADAAMMMQLGMDGVFVGSGCAHTPCPLQITTCPSCVTSAARPTPPHLVSCTPSWAPLLSPIARVLLTSLAHFASPRPSRPPPSSPLAHLPRPPSLPPHPPSLSAWHPQHLQVG